MKNKRLFLILLALYAIVLPGALCATPPEKPFEKAPLILTVSTDGFKKILTMLSPYITLEKGATLNAMLDQTVSLLQSDQDNNRVVIMVWNDVSLKITTYLAPIKTLKRYHLEYIGRLIESELIRWLESYANAHQNEILFVQEIYHFLKTYLEMLPPSLIPYQGVMDRLEYAQYQFARWRPLIIPAGLAVGAFLLLSWRAKKRKEQEARERAEQKEHEFDNVLTSYLGKWKELGDQKENDNNTAVMKAYIARSLAEIQMPLNALKQQPGPGRSALVNHLVEVEALLSLHKLPDNLLVYLFKHTDDQSLLLPILQILQQRHTDQASGLKKIYGVVNQPANKLPGDFQRTQGEALAKLLPEQPGK